MFSSPQQAASGRRFQLSLRTIIRYLSGMSAEPQPLAVTLSDGQKVEVLKRFRNRYGEKLKEVENELRDILNNLAEADFIAAYLGDQPEVAELRAKKADVEVLERRRQHLLKIIDRLDKYIPNQPISPTAPTGNTTMLNPSVKTNLKRY
jgi:hypothetical protein